MDMIWESAGNHMYQFLSSLKQLQTTLVTISPSSVICSAFASWLLNLEETKQAQADSFIFSWELMMNLAILASLPVHIKQNPANKYINKAYLSWWHISCILFSMQPISTLINN
jgi:hypothetical protein